MTARQSVTSRYRTRVVIPFDTTIGMPVQFSIPARASILARVRRRGRARGGVRSRVVDDFAESLIHSALAD
jgi:hypothetical protein